jgi:long-chain fatty acid transport protein
MNKLRILSLAGLVGVGGVANANGFLLNEFDAKAVGRGNASTATDVDPSSIYYNIGGLAVADGTRVMLTGTWITPSASFTDATTGMKTDSNTGAQVLPGIFISQRISDMFAAGVGFYTPFGLAISWPDGSEQTDVIHSESLHTFFITPSVGVNLGSFIPGLSVGGGFDIVPASIDLKQDIYFGTDRGTGHLGGTALGIGGRLGVMYRPHWEPRMSLGVMWRSDVTESFSGNGNFEAAPPYRTQLPADGAIKTSVTLPQSISGGVAYKPIDDFEIEANVVWTNWSKFKQLSIDVPTSMGSGTMAIVQDEQYQNKTTFRIGAEYHLPHLSTAVRVGYIYDPTPVPATHLTAQLPDIDRNDLTAGASYSLGNYDVHLGLLWVLHGSRTTATDMYTPQYKGTYDVSAFVGSLTFAGKFGK